MTLIDNILNLFGYTKAQVTNPPPFLSASAGYYGNTQWTPDLEQAESQADLYRVLPAIYTAVKTVGEASAIVPLNVYELEREEKKPVVNHRFEQLLRRPNPLSSRFEFLYETFAQFNLTGNCYWWLNRRSEDEEPSEMWTIPTHMIRPVPDAQMFVRGYMYQLEDGSEIPIEPWEICHFKKYNPRNRFVGLSPVESISVTAVGDMAMNKWNRDFFHEDNAKASGILSFADHIDDVTWERMRRDMNNRHGGNKRNSIMRIRGSGQGKVDWVSTNLSQNDMQFLQARKWNRTEIFDLFAPFLVPLMDLNSTEANSKTAEVSFSKYTIYPQLEAISQKITNDIIGVYGDDLIVEFDDVRVDDRQLKLAEIASYSVYHTIDEVRAVHYGDDPLGDQRGEKLPAEIGQAETSVPDEPNTAMVPDAPGDNDEEIKAYLAQLSDGLKEIKAQIAQPARFDASPTFTVNVPEKIDTTSQPADYTKSDSEDTDLSKWRKKSLNRMKAGKSAICDFDSDFINDVTVAGVKALLETAQTPDDVNKFFDYAPFDNMLGVIKALIQLDPDDDEAERKIRDEVERRAQRRIEDALEQQQRDLLRGVNNGNAAETVPEIPSKVLETSQVVRDAIRVSIAESVDVAVDVAVDQMATIGIGFDWQLPNVEAREWASQYAGELIGGIDQTTQRGVRTAVAEWIDNGEPLPSLVQDMARLFGDKRAQLIASTEVTTSYARGLLLSYEASGVVVESEWRTAEDELVCPICSGLNGVRARLGEPYIHKVTNVEYNFPAHPGDRCWPAPVIS